MIGGGNLGVMGTCKFKSKEGGRKEDGKQESQGCGNWEK